MEGAEHYKDPLTREKSVQEGKQMNHRLLRVAVEYEMAMRQA